MKILRIIIMKKIYIENNIKIFYLKNNKHNINIKKRF